MLVLSCSDSKSKDLSESYDRISKTPSFQLLHLGQLQKRTAKASDDFLAELHAQIVIKSDELHDHLRGMRITRKAWQVW